MLAAETFAVEEWHGAWVVIVLLLVMVWTGMRQAVVVFVVVCVFGVGNGFRGGKQGGIWWILRGGDVGWAVVGWMVVVRLRVEC